MQIYIDGAAGTTGLALEERLASFPGVELLKPPEELRKDTEARRTFLNRADVAFLCLPDDAAREAVALVENPNTVVIDASTAHRTNPAWAYGFPELSREHEVAIRNSNRIAVPGCHASGFIALVYPLVKGGIISADETLSCYSLTGYSGGGKVRIAEYENGETTPSAAKPYALGLNHKHLPEMRYVCGLTHPPIFVPVLENVYKGMIVTVPLARNAKEIWEYMNDYYKEAGTTPSPAEPPRLHGRAVRRVATNDQPLHGRGMVSVQPFMECDMLDIEAMNGTDDMQIFVFGHETQTVLAARFDNLGKGASGAALQCMKVRMGIHA